MRELWRTLRAVVTEGPGLLVDAMNRWVRDLHRPFDLAGDGTGPAVCSLNGDPWPCRHWLDADRHLNDPGAGR